jgi:hypothetical protein
MSIVMIQKMSGVSPQLIEEITKEMGVKADPPKGLVLHVAGNTPDGVVIVDVWDSEADLDRFNEERLTPAMETVRDRRPDLSPAEMPSPPKVFEVFDTVNGHSTA